MLYCFITYNTVIELLIYRFTPTPFYEHIMTQAGLARRSLRVSASTIMWHMSAQGKPQNHYEAHAGLSEAPL